MESTTNYQIPYPTVTDAVKIASSDLKGMALKMDTSLVQVRGEASWPRGLLSGGEDVLSLAPGVWVVGTPAVASSVTNLPEAVMGTLVVEGVPAGSVVRSVRFMPYSATHEWENRVSTLAGAWRGWQRIESGGAYANPAITEGVDLNTVLTPGAHALPAPYPSGFTNTPSGNNGPSVLAVITSPGIPWAAQEIIQYGTTPRRWWRVGRAYTQGTWNDWVEITSGDGGSSGGRGELPANTDVDMMRGPAWGGSWSISGTGTTGTMSGTLPPGRTGWHPGQIVVHGTGGGSTNLSSQIYMPYTAAGTRSPQVWFRTIDRYAQTGADAWSAWVNLVGGGSSGPSDIPTNALATGGREMRLQLFRDAYPLVSTGGKGAVVFRYDHGLTNFKNVLKPLHDTYNIPAYIAMNSRNWDLAENSGATQAEAASWTNVEWGNHTADHNDKTGVHDVWDTIVNGRIELEAQVGKTVHGFTVPGLPGSDGNSYDKLDGFGNGYASGFSNSYAGSLILNHHAICSGVIGPQYRALDGETRIGGRHYGWENRAWDGPDGIKALIDEAISTKTALTLMLHPRTMNLPGYWTPALADQVLAYVRQQIDDGQLANISYYQSHRAQLSALPSPTYVSGRRDISSELINGWTGTLFVERDGRNVYFRGTLNGEAATSDIAWMLPAGFRPGFVQTPGGSIDYGTGVAIINDAVSGVYQINHYLNRFQIRGANGQAKNIGINHQFRTSDAAPTTLPGVPA